MDDSDKKELQSELEKLQTEKEDLINDIRDLDWQRKKYNET